MKFWAFLKDSYREAVSGWVLPTMLILVGVFVLLVASMSFRPVTFQEDIASRLETMQFLFTFRDPNGGKPVYTVENFRQTNDEVDPWKGNYSFDIVATYRTADDLRRGQLSMIEPRDPFRWTQYLRAFAPYLRDVSVKEVEKPKKKDAGAKGDEAKGDGVSGADTASLRFAVVTKGTKVEERKAWTHAPALFFGAVEVPLLMSQREWVYNLQTTMVNDVGAWLILLVTVIVSAGFVPNTMRKGALDLLVSKPVGRLELLVYKYLGGLVFAFLIIAFLIGSAYLIIGLRFDFWSVNFLGMVPILTFYFAILYSISTLFGVLARNMLVSILVVLVLWGAFTFIGWGNRTYHDSTYQQQKFLKIVGKEEADDEKTGDELFQGLAGIDPTGPGPLSTTLHYLHLITPRTYDLDKRSSRLVAEGVLTADEVKRRNRNKAELPSWGSALGASSVFIVLMLALAHWRFATRDG